MIASALMYSVKFLN